MRAIVVTLCLLVVACGPPAATNEVAESDGYAGSSGAGRIPEEPFTLEAEALVGLWSFDRTCGNYDLVFTADGGAQHYAVADDGMTTSHAGSWATAENNRVVLTMRQLDAEARPAGEALTYHLDVAAPVTGDLMGDFGRDGAAATAITARRCPEEDRD